MNSGLQSTTNTAPRSHSCGAANAALTREDRAMQPVVFIARLVGPLFVVLGIGCLINQTVYADMIGQAVLVPVIIYMSGLMSFLAGVAMLNGYHAWTADWRIIITILGWLLVIAGIVRIMLPAAAAVARHHDLFRRLCDGDRRHHRADHRRLAQFQGLPDRDRITGNNNTRAHDRGHARTGNSGVHR